MTQDDMFEHSFKRPNNYFKLSPRQQWEIDESLGILDWEGSDLTAVEKEKFNNYYK